MLLSVKKKLLCFAWVHITVIKSYESPEVKATTMYIKQRTKVPALPLISGPWAWAVSCILNPFPVNRILIMKVFTLF